MSAADNKPPPSPPTASQLPDTPLSVRKRLTGRNAAQLAEAKRSRTLFAAIVLPGSEDAEELDKKVLIIQNKRLNERQIFYQKLISRLRKEMRVLKQEQVDGMSVRSFVATCWAQLDENIYSLFNCIGAVRGQQSTASEVEEEQESEVEEENWLNSFLRGGNDADGRIKKRIAESLGRLTSVITYAQSQSTDTKNKSSLKDSSRAGENNDGDVDNTSKDSECTRMSEQYNKMILKCCSMESQMSMTKSLMMSRDGEIVRLEEKLAETAAREAKLKKMLESQNTAIKELAFLKRDQDGQNACSKGSAETCLRESLPRKTANLLMLSEAMDTSLPSQLEQTAQLAQSRLDELHEASDKITELITQLTEAELQLQTIPKAILEQTPEFQAMKRAQDEALRQQERMAKTVNEVKSVLHFQKQAYDSQLASLERDEIARQKSMRADLLNLQEQIDKVTNERDSLKCTIDSLKIVKREYPEQLLRDVRRMEKLLSEYVERLKQDNKRLREEIRTRMKDQDKLRHQLDMSTRDDRDLDMTPDSDSMSASFGEERLPVEVKELRDALRVAEGQKRDLRLLLDTYRNAGRHYESQRNAAYNEAKLKAEVKRLMEKLKRYRKRDIAMDGIIKSVKTELDVIKEQEASLADEMEATALAYEEMHEKNRKQLATVAERDALNNRLISEASRRSKCIELLTEEKDLIDKELRQTLKVELDLTSHLNNEQKKRINSLEQSIIGLEAKLHTAVETAQARELVLAKYEKEKSDIQNEIRRYQNQLDVYNKMITEKTSKIQSLTFNATRLAEENKILADRCEKALASACRDDSEDRKLLQFEIQELRENMKCSSCHTNQMDTVIAKCYHVFCSACVQRRIDSRQRKCPQCNQQFGASDVHRLFLFS